MGIFETTFSEPLVSGDSNGAPLAGRCGLIPDRPKPLSARRIEPTTPTEVRVCSERFWARRSGAWPASERLKCMVSAGLRLYFRQCVRWRLECTRD